MGAVAFLREGDAVTAETGEGAEGGRSMNQEAVILTEPLEATQRRLNSAEARAGSRDAIRAILATATSFVAATGGNALTLSDLDVICAETRRRYSEEEEVSQ